MHYKELDFPKIIDNEKNLVIYNIVRYLSYEINTLEKLNLKSRIKCSWNYWNSKGFQKDYKSWDELNKFKEDVKYLNSKYSFEEIFEYTYKLALVKNLL